MHLFIEFLFESQATLNKLLAWLRIVVSAAALETQEPSFWVRYVDDTFAITRNGRQPHLNSIFTDIQFPMKEEKYGELQFLDVKARRPGGEELTASLFRQMTHKDDLQMLSYKRNHLQAHKKSCVKTLFKRMETHFISPKKKNSDT